MSSNTGTTASSKPINQEKLRHAVLDALYKSLDGPTDGSTFSIQRLLDNSKYRTDAEEDYAKHGSEDWLDLAKSCDDDSVSLGNFVRLYDQKENTIYYVDIKQPEQPVVKAPQAHSSSIDDQYDTDWTQHNIEQRHIDTVLARLVVENGHVVPRGYQECMAQMIGDRDLSRFDIPGYGQLCENCCRVLSQSARLLRICLHAIKNDRCRDVFRHHRTTGALRASVASGCHLCSLISSPTGRNPDPFKEGCNVPYVLVFSFFSSDLVVQTIDDLAQRIWVERDNGVRSAPQDVNLFTLGFSNTSAPDVIKLAGQWLRRCLEEDGETCGTPTRSVPSRLLEINDIHGTLNSVRLVLCNELPDNIQYLTLSHCWGKIKMIKLMEDTLESYRINIPLQSLTKTFLEALQVTVWLGFRYIWIDSLCIQQDSYSDWEREAAVMGSIYRQSTCTLAATGAKDGNDGLFFERSPLAFTPCPLFQVNNFHYSAKVELDWPSPLSTRAWALQERHLSPRTLSFGSDQISWTCRRTQNYEGLDSDQICLPKQSFSRLLSPRIKESSANSIWRDLVGIYSKCKLSHWKDKWPAFQGIANEVATAQGWRIVHGLRDHLLGEDLLWYTDVPRSETIDAEEPSWNWLNVQGPAFLDYREFKLETKIVLLTPSELPCAQSDTRISVNGMLQIQAYKFKFVSENFDGTCQRCHVIVTNGVFQRNNQNRVMKGIWCPDTVPIHDGDMWALHFTRSTGLIQDSHSNGLVVAASDEHPGLFRRVGAYEIYSESESESELESGSGSDLPKPGLWGGEKSTIYLI